jgi:undecaprenyl-diphosphatase
MPESAERTERRRRSNLPLFAGSTALVLAVLLGLLLVVRQNAGLLGIDESWADEMLEIRGPAGEWLAIAFDIVGGHLIGTFVIPIGITVVLLLVKRPWAALYFILTAATSAGIVQILKQLVARARPEDMLVTSDFGSFPSGHVANAATMAIALSVIFPRVWVWIAGAVWTLAMAVSRTYLGVHWLTDTIGGILVGVGVGMLFWALFAFKLADEQDARVADRRRHSLRPYDATG